VDISQGQMGWIGSSSGRCFRQERRADPAGRRAEMRGRGADFQDGDGSSLRRMKCSHNGGHSLDNVTKASEIIEKMQAAHGKWLALTKHNTRREWWMSATQMAQPGQARDCGRPRNRFSRGPFEPMPRCWPLRKRSPNCWPILRACGKSRRPTQRSCRKRRTSSSGAGTRLRSPLAAGDLSRTAYWPRAKGPLLILTSAQSRRQIGAPNVGTPLRPSGRGPKTRGPPRKRPYTGGPIAD